MSWSSVPGGLLRAVDVTVTMTHSLISFLSMFTYFYGKWHFKKGIYTNDLVPSHENYISSLSISSLKCKIRTLTWMPPWSPSSSKIPRAPCHIHQVAVKGNFFNFSFLSSTFPFLILKNLNPSQSNRFDIFPYTDYESKGQTHKSTEEISGSMVMHPTWNNTFLWAVEGASEKAFACSLWASCKPTLQRNHAVAGHHG